MSKSDEIKLGDRNAMCVIIRAAREFADADLQERSWVRGEFVMAGYLEAYEEIVETPLVDDMFADIAHLGCSEDMIGKLRKFVELLLEFEKTVPAEATDEEVISSSGWPNVRNAAGDFLESAHSWYQTNCGNPWARPWTWRGKHYGPCDGS